MGLWKMECFVFFIGLLTSCAQQRDVSGGQKDVSSPQIVRSIPNNFITHFSGHQIMLEFDEYVEIKNLTGELVVSPPLDYPVTYRIKGKRVYINIRDTLLANTTYNFNFGNAIVDLNEGNSLDSNLFVFSTGSYIDSGIVRGTVRDAFTLKPVVGATVILYDSKDDSVLYKGFPKYIAKTDVNGYYELKYLKPVDYQIFALEIPGPDYAYQPFNKLGFFPELIHPSVNDTIDFFLFSEKDSAQYIEHYFSSNYFSFILGFHSNLSTPHFELTPSSDTTYYYIEEIAADSFKIWVGGNTDLDSVMVYISDQTGYTDTARIDLAERKTFYKKLKRKKQKRSPVRIRVKTRKGVFDYFDTLHIQLGRPIAYWNFDSIWFIDENDTINLRLLIDSGKAVLDMPNCTRGTTNELRMANFHYPWQTSHQYGFIFYPGAFTDLIGQTNDTTVATFKTVEFEDYGSFRLFIKVPDYEGPILLQLLDKEGELLRNYSLKSAREIYHKLFVPGNYQMRLVIDRNGNNKWDSGILNTKTLPETVVYYQGKIEIRPNWDVEETWTVYLKP